MPPKLLCDHQRSDEWQALRRGKIGASQAAACLGLCPFRSRQAAWRQIMGRETEAELRANENNPALRWGVQFEAPARLAYEARTGHWVEETGLWVNTDFPWLCCSPDGLIGADGLCEVKAPEFPPAKVPPHYRIQCLVQLAVMERSWVDFWAWPWAKVDPPPEPFLTRIERAGIPNLILLLKRFYDAYVATATPPPRLRRRKVA